MKKLTGILLAVMLLMGATPILAHDMDHHAVSPTDAFTPAEAPLYPLGTEVILAADHMPGMEGAVARISGAFDTVLYAINYTREDTGEVVLWHRWVIHEEIENPMEEPYEVGNVVTLLPGHISGMGGEGVQAEIVEVLIGTAYMVDFTPTDGTDPVVNHQWVSEEEVLPYNPQPGMDNG